MKASEAFRERYETKMPGALAGATGANLSKVMLFPISRSAPSDQGQMLTAALDYAARGWSVFPCRPGEKTPIGGSGHDDATTDAARIRAWWSTTPDANIGLALKASGLVAIDADTYKPECGIGAFTLPETLTQRSARGGTHYVYRAVPGHAYPGKLCEGVDIKHAGYIMAAPSTFEGRAYEWLNDAAPAPVPAFLTPRRARTMPAMPAAPVHPLEMANFRGLLQRADNDLDRDRWVKLGNALKYAFGDGIRPDFLAFSYRWPGTVEGNPEEVWDGLKPDGTVTLATAKYLLTKPGAAPAPIADVAVGIALQIVGKVQHVQPQVTDVPVNAEIIRAMIAGAFWSSAKSRLFILNESEDLIEFAPSEAWKFLCRRFGTPVDVESLIATHPPADEDDARKAIHKAVIDPIMDHLKYENQRNAVEWSVDMFADTARLEICENTARAVLTHKPLDASGAADPACVADYRAHFPELDAVLEYIVASRFARDRKKSYLWIFAVSDWGKGFFMGRLKELGLVVEMSVREIEGIFEGRPAGRSPEDFKRAMVLAIDEFKAVKSELKQLQSEIYLAPKFQMTARVEIFTKLFLSAENVASLVGENGVEDQFANRMSMLTGATTIDSRPVYIRDRDKYARSVRIYVATEMNRLIAEYQALGREGSAKRAADYLSAFLGTHGLGQHFRRLSESIPDIADDIVRHVRSRMMMIDGQYLKNASKVVGDYIDETYDASEKVTLRRRKDDIIKHMSADLRGNASHRTSAGQIKAVKLREIAQ